VPVACSWDTTPHPRCMVRGAWRCMEAMWCLALRGLKRMGPSQPRIYTIVPGGGDVDDVVTNPVTIWSPQNEKNYDFLH
jgi:hypothetical protein